MNLHLSGRRAIVTGAAQGIGLSIVQAFVTEGMQVAAFDIDGTGLQAARAAGASLTTTIDLAERSSVAEAVDGAAKQFGGLDILVNCAGVCADRSDARLKTSPSRIGWWCLRPMCTAPSGVPRPVPVT